jgi:hypothetical protein
MGRSRVRAQVGDACVMPTHLGSIAGVFTCFGLQQLPNPADVLADWVQGVAEGTHEVVCYTFPFSLALCPCKLLCACVFFVHQCMRVGVDM